MNTELIGKSWDKLAGRHEEVMTKFYARFFEEYPDYKRLFPENLDRQMKKMVETMALVARVSDETEIAHPHLVKMGNKHTGYELRAEDLERFKKVFLKVVGEYCGNDWNSECQKAWVEVFDNHIIPYMVQGLGHTSH